MSVRIADLADDPPAWSGALLVARGSDRVEWGPTDERYQAGSISKHLMSVVVLSLVGRSVLDLDAPIARWVPTLPAHLGPVTLRQLLSHTSGIGHWGQIPGLPPLLEVPPPRDELVAMVLSAPRTTAPGERWRYSSPAFLVVALVVEAATGSVYSDLVTEIVLGPAAMTSTTSGAFPLGKPSVAVGHRNGRVLEPHPAFAALPGSGDLWTTTEDLLHYSRALRQGALLRPDLASQLWQQHAQMEQADAVERPTAAWAYGFGTFLGRVLGQDAWFVPGDNPGYQSLLAYLPATDTDVVVLSNEESGVDTVLGHLTLR